MSKGIIYYTDNQLGEPIFSLVQNQILKSGLPVVSVSLKPIEFGENIAYKGESGYVSMVNQIKIALENSKSEYVFFCEHDVLYHPSHFDFTPPKQDIWYYNKNNWRWRYRDPEAIRYDRMLPLSALCVNREFALDHYRRRVKRIEEIGMASFSSHEPSQARKWGYEPGTKKKKRGGFSDDDFDTWESEYPNIDIRHDKSFSIPKTTLSSFKHAPENWMEISIYDIAGWDLKTLFSL